MRIEKLFKSSGVFPSSTVVKNLPANVGDTEMRVQFMGGEGSNNPLQYSCLENSMDRGAWRAAVHRVIKRST